MSARTTPVTGAYSRSAGSFGPVELSLHEASTQRLKRLQALSEAFSARRADYFDECGLADINAVLEGDASLHAAQSVASETRMMKCRIAWSPCSAQLYCYVH